MARAPSADRELRQVLAEAYLVNDQMNQIVLRHLKPAAWRATLPDAKGRTIAGIFAHVHNIRRKWLRLSVPGVKLPPPLSRTRCTQKEAARALAESAARCAEMLGNALFGAESGVRAFRRDGWAKEWPAGGAAAAYMMVHDAHHRGQACMLAHQLGHPLPPKAAYGIWMWEKLWKDCGFTHPR